jgi:hypothetical protein
LPHWCTCSQQTVFSNTNESVIDISKQFVGKINEKFTNLSQCENLSLSEVKNASRLVTSDTFYRIHTRLSIGFKVQQVQQSLLNIKRRCQPSTIHL